MNAIRNSRSPAVRAVFGGVLAGVLVRLGVFANDYLSPDVGGPAVLWGSAAVAVVVGAAVYAASRR